MRIQNPAVGPFNRDALQWDEQVVAHIPHNRLEDFLSGENSCAENPTSFYRKKRYVHAEGSLRFPNEDSYLEHVYFHCAYGPEVGARGQKNAECHPMRRKESKKRGCMCAFEVRRLYLHADVIKITYKEMSHVDSAGKPCHGFLDPSSANKPSLHSPYISQQLRDWITYRLERGASEQEIMARHREVLLAEAGQSGANAISTKDHLLTMTDVKNISASFAKARWRLHKLDEQSVHMWRGKNMHKVFFYQMQNSLELGDESIFTPVIIGIQTPWQKAKMLQYGHENVLVCNLTCSSNKYQFQLITILVVDPFFNAIPVAWVITPTSKDHDITRWMHALHKSMVAALPTWRPSAIVIDDPSLEPNAFRTVWNENFPVLLSLWHVRRAWLKNAVSKVKGWSTRAMLLGKLITILESNHPSHFTKEQKIEKTTGLVEDLFSACPATCSSFINYFRQEWMCADKISLWAKLIRDIPDANQEINAAFENYHVNLKRRGLIPKNCIMGQRMDWLIYTLENDVEQQYMQMETLKENGLVQNPRHKRIILGAFHRARFIPMEHVELPSNPQEPARVRSTSDPCLEHFVYNVGQEGTCCTCAWSRRGSFCKHSVKVCQVYNTGPTDENVDKEGRLIGVDSQQNGDQSIPIMMSPDVCHIYSQALDQALIRRAVSQQFPKDRTFHSENVQKDIMEEEAELKSMLDGDPLLLAHYLPLLVELKGELQRIQCGKTICRTIQHPAASFTPHSAESRTRLLHQRPDMSSPNRPPKAVRRDSTMFG